MGFEPHLQNRETIDFKPIEIWRDSLLCLTEKGETMFRSLLNFPKKIFAKECAGNLRLNSKRNVPTKIYFSGTIENELTQPLQIIAFHARAQRKLMIRLNAFLVENE